MALLAYSHDWYLLFSRDIAVLFGSTCEMTPQILHAGRYLSSPRSHHSLFHRIFISLSGGMATAPAYAASS